MAKRDVEPRGTDAFHPKIARMIETAIDVLAARIKCTHSVPKLTYREMLNLIAPSDHIEFLLKARQIADIGRYAGKDTDDISMGKHDSVQMYMTFGVSGNEDSPVMPYVLKYQHDDPVNRDLAMELKRCAHEHADAAIEWGCVKAVFKYLNTHCRTPQQMRYLWPSILGIMAVSSSEDVQTIRNTIVQHTLPRSLPNLPPKVREMCKRTAATVAMALMLPPLEDEPYERGYVEITFKVASEAIKLADGWYAYPIN